MSLTVKWGRERITLPLPPPSSTLGALRQSLADYTHLPPHAFKLIHAGAVMKDDDAPLAAFALRQNPTIALIGGSGPAVPSPPAPRSEHATLAQIAAELAQVRTALVPGVHAFLDAPVRDPAHTKEHARLGELLLQSLLRLDGIPADGDWTHARDQRKGAVREVQALLDSLDDAWNGAR